MQQIILISMPYTTAFNFILPGLYALPLVALGYSAWVLRAQRPPLQIRRGAIFLTAGATVAMIAPSAEFLKTLIAIFTICALLLAVLVSSSDSDGTRQ